MTDDGSTPAVPSASNGGDGLLIATTPSILSFLQSALDSPELPDDLRSLASDLSSLTSVPYRSLRNTWLASPTSTRPPLSHLFRDATFVFSSPKPREKSKELKERLKKLEELAEKKAYRDLVKDITPKESAEPFSSYKDQIGFGLHVILIMATGFLVGYIAFRALFNRNAVMNAAGGILGLVCGMLLETVLFIIRSSTSSRTISKLKQL